MANPEPSSDTPPPFEEPFEGADVEQRIYGTILQTREPTSAGEIAETVGCDPKTARKYVSWFADLGIVIRHNGSPVTYERNDSYFEWRRVNQLAADHSIDVLQERVRDLTEQISGYEERYESSDPSDVDAIDTRKRAEDRSIEDVYRDLGDWATALKKRERYERARQQQMSGTLEKVSG